LLGLSAGAVAVSSASSAAPDPHRRSTPDPTGGFGQPATAETARREGEPAALREQSRTDAVPGVVQGPQSITSAGSARLSPSGEAIDHTPLSRREPRGPWRIGG
jgi:hypothetical protein